MTAETANLGSVSMLQLKVYKVTQACGDVVMSYNESLEDSTSKEDGQPEG